MYLFLLPLVVISLAVPPARAKKTETGFLDRTVTVAGRQYKYQVFVPDNWTKKKKWPVILFLHGAGERADDDLVVPVTESRRMAEAMKALGGEVHYTEYPGVDHNSWDKAYAESELLPWMLSKTTSINSSK